MLLVKPETFEQIIFNEKLHKHKLIIKDIG